MQYILQDFEDTKKLADILDKAGLNYSMHKVIPFIGEMTPEPEIIDPNKVIMFGSYSLRHYAAKHNLTPGVFSIPPFFNEYRWGMHPLNNMSNTILSSVEDVVREGTTYPEELVFVRPLEDSKEIAGTVMTIAELINLCKSVLTLLPEEQIVGSLNPNTILMISTPKNIQKEWRIWVINNKIVTYSLYKMGSKVYYANEIDEDAKEFAQQMIDLNPEYSKAYILDVCRCDEGLKILETNCINAAGFYAADMHKIIEAFEE